VGDVTDTEDSARELTGRAVDSLAACPDPRLRELLGNLIRSLHAFVIESAVTERELGSAVQFLTDVGHMCSDRRQEFILLSDTLGVSMMVDLVNHGASSVATESTVLGPFYASGSPWRNNGDAITDDLGARPLVVSGRVRSTSGEPIPGAILDVWQNAANRLYAVQDEKQVLGNLRGRFRSEFDGSYAFRTIRPVDYPIPADGPVGRMLQATGRHPWRPAHIHVIASADGFVPVTTHLFDSESPYLDSDVVFGVKQSLVRRLVEHDPSLEVTPEGIDGPWYTIDTDIVLRPTPDVVSEP
jgi:catechol 1,2-dioxygenase